MVEAVDGLGTRAQARLSDDLVALVQRCNLADDGSVDVRADYLEAIIAPHPHTAEGLDARPIDRLGVRGI